MSTSAVTNIPFLNIDGTENTLSAYQGQAVLVVNVASKCGLTKQYEALEALYERYREQGLVVLGFPANNFAGQEPGSNDEIAQFCTATFGVQFPMAAKISVSGSDTHPLYQALIESYPHAQRNNDSQLLKLLQEKGLAPATDTEIMWNFEKFLIGRDGQVLGRFAPDITPDDPRIVGAIETALAG